MVFNSGVRTASFLRIIKAFNFDLVGENCFIFVTYYTSAQPL